MGSGMTNVALTREYWRVWTEEGPAGLLARYDDFFTDDFDWHPPIAEITGARYIGREGWRQYVTDVQENLNELHGELDEVTQIPADVVRCRAHMHAEETTSGVVIDAPMVGIARFRDGLVCWAWGSYDLAAAERIAEAMARGEEPRI